MTMDTITITTADEASELLSLVDEHGRRCQEIAAAYEKVVGVPVSVCQPLLSPYYHVDLPPATAVRIDGLVRCAESLGFDEVVLDMAFYDAEPAVELLLRWRT